MKTEELEVSDLIHLFKRYYKIMVVSVLISSGGFLTVAYILPKVFKSIATITIFTKYFQNPLIKDMLPEIYDSFELRAQRENLIRKALDQDFLDEIGDKYKMFKSSPGTPARLIERDLFLKNIEIYSIQSTTFQLSLMGPTAEQTRRMLNEILERVVRTFSNERRKTIERMRDSIRKRVEMIAISLQNSTDPLASARPELIKKELERLESQIQSLKTQYTDQHPEVSRLNARASLIRTWLNSSSSYSKNQADASDSPPPLVGGEPKETTLQVYEDLVKKMNYLNIILDMEKDNSDSYVTIMTPPSLPSAPLKPNKSLFLLWGFLSGLLVSTFCVLIKEYFRRSSPSIESFAMDLNIPYLGELPLMEWDPFLTKKESSKSAMPRESPQQWN